MIIITFYLFPRGHTINPAIKSSINKSWIGSYYSSPDFAITAHSHAQCVHNVCVKNANNYESDLRERGKNKILVPVLIIKKLWHQYWKCSQLANGIQVSLHCCMLFKLNSITFFFSSTEMVTHIKQLSHYQYSLECLELTGFT